MLLVLFHVDNKIKAYKVIPINLKDLLYMLHQSAIYVTSKLYINCKYWLCIAVRLLALLDWKTDKLEIEKKAERTKSSNQELKALGSY